jgi:predicted RNA binding protein YcfA (HicA-like mRNA interferase family)
VVQGYTKQVKAILRDHGWELLRHGKGDHEIWTREDTSKAVVVDGKIALHRKCGPEAGGHQDEALA